MTSMKRTRRTYSVSGHRHPRGAYLPTPVAVVSFGIIALVLLAIWLQS